METVFYNLQEAGAEHNGDSQEEGKLGGSTSGASKDHGAQDGGTGPGCAGDQGQELEKAYVKRRLVGDVSHPLHLKVSPFIRVFYDDEQHAIDN